MHPLHWLTQAVLPSMIERRQGKIVAYGSATALRGLKTLCAYSTARAAQVGYIQSVGVKAAPHNVQSADCYPPELMEKPSFVASLKRQVPVGRLGTPREDAMFALSRQRRMRVHDRPGVSVRWGLGTTLITAAGTLDNHPSKN